jgi:hypothetical protein
VIQKFYRLRLFQNLFQKVCLKKILKRANQLQLFRRLEKSSKTLISSKCAVEFLQLCLTPTFAKVSNCKAKKWKRTAIEFEKNVLKEEIIDKKKQITTQREGVNRIYDEIRRQYSKPIYNIHYKFKLMEQC